MKAIKYAEKYDLSIDDISRVLTDHGFSPKSENHKLTDEEVQVLDAYLVARGTTSDAAVDETDDVMPGATTVPDDDDEVLPDSDDDSADVEEAPTKVFIVGRRGTRSNRPTTKPLTRQEVADRDVAYNLRVIQKSARNIPAAHYTTVKFENSRRPVALYRPTFTTIEHGGQFFYAYDSLIPSDGQIWLTPELFERYAPGGSKAKQHMPFVSDDVMNEMFELFRSYSFFNNECSQPECKEIRREKFSPGLEKKAQLILRKHFLPPAFAARTDRSDRVMELKGTCYVHWLLDQTKDILIPQWMAVTAETQNLPLAERFEARISRFMDVIEEIQQAVSDKAKKGGEHPADTEEIGKMLIAFADEMTGAA